MLGLEQKINKEKNFNAWSVFNPDVRQTLSLPSGSNTTRIIELFSFVRFESSWFENLNSESPSIVLPSLSSSFKFTSFAVLFTRL